MISKFMNNIEEVELKFNLFFYFNNNISKHNLLIDLILLIYSSDSL